MSWNKSAEKIYGYTEDETSGKSIQMLVPPGEKEEITQILKKISHGKPVKPYETKRVKKDGEEIDVSLSMSPIKNEAGTIIGASTIARDITESKKAEKTLLESKDLLVETGRIGKVGGWKINIDTNKLTWTDETYRIHEVGRNFKPTIENAVGFYTSESRLIMDQAVAQAIEHDKPFDLELQITTAKGNIRSIHAKGEINKKNREVQGSFHDITERKKTEEKLQESRDKIEMINEKLNVANELTRHDALNKVGVIVGQTYLLNEKCAENGEIAHRLDKIQKACKVIETIFASAKTYKSTSVEKLTYCDVEKALDEAGVQFPNLTVKVINDCKGLRLLADGLLSQIFYNLIDNSTKYGKKITTIRVRYEKSGQYLKLIYEDDGVGVLIEDKPLLFEEGFSTGGSTGFGLFLIKKMIDVYGWTIIEEGEPGKGAKFVFTIPLSSISELKHKSNGHKKITLEIE